MALYGRSWCAGGTLQLDITGLYWEKGTPTIAGGACFCVFLRARRLGVRFSADLCKRYF